MTKVVLDSSVIIALSTLGFMSKLKSIFNEIIVAKAVYEEICSAGQGLVGSFELKEAVKNRIIVVKNVDEQTSCNRFVGPVGDRRS